jgi:hypothetical protein
VAKQAIQINREDFQNVISSLELNGGFTSRSALWSAIEGSEWAKKLTPRPLTAQVAMLKAKEFNLDIKTPLGRKGATKGAVRPQRKRISLEMIDDIEIPEKYKGLKERMKKGSIKAHLKAHCLSCSNWIAKEVRLCQIKKCALFPIRPFQKG